MSRIGKKPVPVPAGVNVSVTGQDVTVAAGSQKLSFTHRPEVKVRFDAAAKAVVVERTQESREARAMHGLTRAIIQNMVLGVTKGFQKELEIVGVGWTAAVQGKALVLSVGYADPREIPIPAGLTVEAKAGKITVKGADKQVVGQFAADVRKQRKPEPYNGKGIKYANEVIIRKAGKAFAGGGG